MFFISNCSYATAQTYTTHLDLTKLIPLFYAGKEAIEVEIPQRHQDVMANDEQ